MKQKLFCLLVVFLGCSLLASPNRFTDNSSLCTQKSTVKMISVMPAVVKADTEVQDDLELLPMHQMVNSLL